MEKKIQRHRLMYSFGALLCLFFLAIPCTENVRDIGVIPNRFVGDNMVTEAARNASSGAYHFRTPIVLPDAAVPEIKAEGYAVYDMDSGTMISESSMARIWPLASLTKLATVLMIVEQNPDWNKIIQIQNIPEANGKGVQFVYPGDMISIRDALAAALIPSDNLAAANLAQYFHIDAAMLALRFPTLSLADYTGLNPANVASIQDVVAIARDAWKYDSIRDLSGRASYDILVNEKPVHLEHTNPLLAKDSDWIASKTGYVPESGGNVVALRRLPDGHVVILVILGADGITQRFDELAKLSDWVKNSVIW